MSKITFRADEELVERIEARDASKSEIMREALREYLDGDSGRASTGDHASAERGRERDVREEVPRESRRTPDHDRSPTRESATGHGDGRTAGALDAVLTERVDELVAERLAAWEARQREREAERAQDVNVNVTLESEPLLGDADAGASASASRASASDDSSDARNGAATDSDVASETETNCGQCGESLSEGHVYCPNCGEKASRRVFCECGDEVRSDWGFCPSCGRRTPAADVLDRS